jgi:hypothetical protein
MKNIVHILLLTIFIAGSSQLSAFQYLEGNKVPSANNNDLLTQGIFSFSNHKRSPAVDQFQSIEYNKSFLAQA